MTTGGHYVKTRGASITGQAACGTWPVPGGEIKGTERVHGRKLSCGGQELGSPICW